MRTVKSNAPPLALDMREYLEGQDKSEGGIARLTVLLTDSLNAILSCDYVDDDKGGRDVFNVRDYVLDKPRTETGFDQKQQGARNVAMMTQLFGFESYAIPHAAVTARDKALPAAIAINHYYRDSDGKLMLFVMSVPSVTGGKRNVISGIPARDMFELVDEKDMLTAAGRATLASFTPVFHRERKRLPKDDAELREYMLAYPVETSGMLEPSFRSGKGQPLRAVSTSDFIKQVKERAIKDGVLPAPRSGKPKSPTDSGTDMLKSIRLLSDWVGLISSPDGETETVPLPEHEKALDALCEAWAAYRVAYPAASLI